MGAKPSAKTELIREEILRVLAEHEFGSVAEIAEWANLAPGSTRNQLYGLRSSGEVVNVGRDRWMVSGPDSRLSEVLGQSISQFVTTCEGSRYALMLTYHQLKMFEELVSNLDVDEEVLGQITVGVELAEKEHERHVKEGTCILSEPPKNGRTEQWKR